MIYTCTLNPSLDYYLEFDHIALGKLNRSKLEFFEAGGKGINVSIVLNNMKIPSRALGFVGGFTEKVFIRLLDKYEYVQPSFTYVEGQTRINVKIKDQMETEFNANGPEITVKDMEQMIKKVQRLNGDDILVFSGSCHLYLAEMVETMIKSCAESGVQFVLDTQAELTKRLLPYRPFLIKPNLAELEALFNCTIFTQDDILKHAKECVRLGAQNVIVSLGEDGSILVNESGSYHATVPDSKIVSTVGAGDSMVAGFVMNTLRSRDILTAFKYANGCGIATSLLRGLATREKVESLIDQIKIEKLD